MPLRSEVVHVLATQGRDAQSVCSILQRHHVRTSIVGNLEELAAALGEDTGAVVLTEEAMAPRNWTALIQALQQQPSWSSYPFVFIVSRRNSELSAKAPLSLLPPELTNVMVLEKPMGSTTLVSAVQWALGGRARQFQTRDHLLEMEKAAARQRLMTRELAHRVKNTIAVLQSIVSQTMRPFPEMVPVRDQLIERFGALARAHDLLLATDFRSAMFHELIETSTSVHDADGQQTRFAGPDFEISPQAALSFALVFHELATNASKYGALSTPSGRVEVNWEFMPDQLFKLSWRELGGPPVHGPSSKGFGSRLISATLAAMGEVEVSYAATGIELSFAGPATALTHAIDQSFELS